MWLSWEAYNSLLLAGLEVGEGLGPLGSGKPVGGRGCREAGSVSLRQTRQGTGDPNPYLLCLCWGERQPRPFLHPGVGVPQCSWGGRRPVHRPLLPWSVRFASLSVPQGVQPFTIYKACSPLTPQKVLETVP